jgi:hypothetical protein
MTLLRCKAVIYRHLGIYLAHKEELKYLTSNEFWVEFQEQTKWYRDHKEIQELLLALWQSSNGFTRPMTDYTFKEPQIVYAPLNWILVLFKTIWKG